MEPNKVTVFLFLLLVVILAFSGFMIYDGLGGFPADRAWTSDGVLTVMEFNNPYGAVSGTGTHMELINPNEGGVR